MKKSSITQSIAGVMLVGTLASCSLSSNPETVTKDTAAPSTDNTPVSTVSDRAATENIPDVSFTLDQTVEYDSPAGKDQVEFNITVEKGIIKSLQVTPKAPADHKGSVWAQGKFVEAVPSIIGKPVNTLGVHAVGGASLTTQAFEKFLTAAVEKNTKK